ncbi:MAG: hypothetical protein RLZZ387_4054 [Chloroflexota bacterium]|jgi:hypothetical protein
MRFPALDQVALPCTFEAVVPGKLHADGRRYLPLIVLRLAAAQGDGRAALLGVVDRHHVVDHALIGRSGVARLVFLLSAVRLQDPPRQGFFAEPEALPDRPVTAPLAYGQVTAVHAWEAERQHLPYESLYTELVLDVGRATIGVRTSATAASLAESIGKEQITPGDWLSVSRSRVDILGFETTAQA